MNRTLRILLLATFLLAAIVLTQASMIGACNGAYHTAAGDPFPCT